MPELQAPPPLPAITPAIGRDLAPPLEPSILPIVIGDSGTQRYGGYFSEEFNNKWRDETRVDTVEEMRRTDSTVEEGLIALKAPILSADWDVICESEDPKDKEITDWSKKVIFNMDRTWKDFLREALTYFDFGFSVFEKCYAVGPDGRIWLTDLAPRIQRSIQRWQLSNRTRGIIQYVRTDEAQTTQVQIPIEKLLVLTNNKEGDDLTGRSVLRPAYRHYFAKDLLYRIANISAERYGVGVPVVTTPEGSGPEDQSKAYEMGRQIRANEQSVIVLPSEKWKISILVPQGGAAGSVNIKEMIDHHDRMILSSMLAAFLNLGSTDAGSFALSKDQHGFLLTHVEDKASYFTEQFNKQVLEPLVKLNFGEREYYPKLNFTNIGDSDLKIMSEWLVNLKNSGMINPDLKLKQWTRINFGLPVFTDDEMAAMEVKEIEEEVSGLETPENEEPVIDPKEKEQEITNTPQE